MKNAGLIPPRIPDELSVEVWVTVLSKLIENKPVSQIGLVENVLQAFPDIVIILSPHLTNYPISPASEPVPLLTVL